jgi:hypothetical protein
MLPGLTEQRRNCRLSGLLPLALLLAAMAGCQVQQFNPGYRSSEHSSEAMNVLRAAVVVRSRRSSPIRDVAAEALPGPGSSESPSGSDAPGGHWFQPYGPRPGAEPVLRSALRDPAEVRDDVPLFLVWMPVRGRESPRQAGTGIRRMLVDAYLSTLGRGYRLDGYDPSSGALPAVATSRPASGAGPAWYRGPGCEADTCPLRLRLHPQQPFRMPAPDFLGHSGEVWFTTVSLRPPRGEWQAELGDLLSLSTYLPAWVYLYVPAGNAGLSYPVLFKAGAPLYFIASG